MAVTFLNKDDIFPTILQQGIQFPVFQQELCRPAIQSTHTILTPEGPQAFITLFYVTGGDPWPEALPRANEDGSANWAVASFVMVYTVVVVWVMLEVVFPRRDHCNSSMIIPLL